MSGSASPAERPGHGRAVRTRLPSSAMSRKSSAAIAIAAVAGLLAGPSVLTAPTASAAPLGAAVRQAPGPRFFDLPTRDGLKLKANVVEPTTPGPHPAIVMPASWAINDFEYLLQAAKLVRRGYIVLSFTPRGLFGSEGQIDVAGPKELSDVSAALDWLLKNTSADPGRLGVAGVSYGGDMALQMPAADSRVKAVGGLSAYADLTASLYPDKTRVALTVPVLWGLGKILGRTSPEFDEMMTNFQKAEHESDPKVQKVLAWARQRSGSTYVDAINRNKPAVFLANAWGDSFFPPNQYVDFFNRLTVPGKHLEFAPGDHATTEGLGLAGLPNPVWDSFTRFFDRYLAGRQDVPADAPIVLTPKVNKPGLQNPFEPGKRESYPGWAAIADCTESFAFPGSPSIRGGTDTPASSGVHFIDNTVEQFTGLAPAIALRSVNRRDGVVWQTGALGGGRTIRGDVRLKTSVSTSAPTNTFVAYLYDVDAGGTGRLITYAPQTLRDVRTGVALPVDLRLHTTAYDLPAGHRLALVIDTKDFRYMDAGKPGSTLTFGDASTLEVPVR